MKAVNNDSATIRSFGREWSRFDQTSLSEVELSQLFASYFDLFPWDALGDKAEGFDMGCGSGRWARLVAPKVGTLHCVDASEEALAIAHQVLCGKKNVFFWHAQTDTVPLAQGSQDFGYSLGVLHHIPDTYAALSDCVRLLKPGAPFLLYLYYRFDNRPWWYRVVWSASNLLRLGLHRLPDKAKTLATDLLAATIYWPLARFALLLEKMGAHVASIPLSFYRNKSFYTMRTDSRDRFGTPLEQRFTRDEIESMMNRAGLKDIQFSDREPYWVAVGYRT